ncbi:hypothetical protein AURDEDRAFT_121561 [Auricularia subglabra TFB-10046 SS5]|nr:hypothetical protein AURDEDRAFT_121561 [Auricularia subglabra TFB-10046 SS5]
MFSQTVRRSLSTSTRARLADKSFTQSVKESVAGVAAARQFQNTGKVGSKFEKGGEVAEAAEKVGGPFSSDGAIGKQFSAKEGGVVGGTGQAAASAAKGAAKESMKKDHHGQNASGHSKVKNDPAPHAQKAAAMPTSNEQLANHAQVGTKG